MTCKPIEGKNYGSIPHLIGSRLGEGDHHINEGQNNILTKAVRDFNDLIIVQEKLDGANVGILKKEGRIIPIIRAGWRAADSDQEQFKMFDLWVREHENLFLYRLKEGERLVGEWLAMAHGTKYNLINPFVAFDIMRGNDRLPYTEFLSRIDDRLFVTAKLLHIGGAVSIKKVEKLLGEFGHHGAQDPAEGAVWRLEKKGKVELLAKYVRHAKEDGKYFSEIDPLWNWRNWK